jgi:hypothetical protein
MWGELRRRCALHFCALSALLLSLASVAEARSFDAAPTGSPRRAKRPAPRRRWSAGTRPGCTRQESMSGHRCPYGDAQNHGIQRMEARYVEAREIR